MARKKQNDRCPLQAECEKVCQWQGHELDCLYYEVNARPGYEIDDQEEIREKRWNEADEASGYGFLPDDEDDPDDDVESPSAAENAAVAPPEAADEVLLVPAEVVPQSLHLDGSTGVTEKIKRAMYDAAKQFVYIGYLLWEVQRYGYYNEKGYASVYEYAEAELGFKRSSTKNFIAISETFGNEYYGKFNGDYCFKPTMFLKPAYRDFKYSQLCEMLSMSDKQRSKVTPDMTVKQIREMKREGEPDLPPNMETIPIPLPDDAPDSGQTSGQCSALSPVRHSRHFINGCPWVLYDENLKWLLCKTRFSFDPLACYDITVKVHRDP